MQYNRAGLEETKANPRKLAFRRDSQEQEKKCVKSEGSHVFSFTRRLFIILLLLLSNITKTRLASHAGFTSVCLNVATWILVGANGHDTYVKYTCIRTHLRRTGPGRPRSRQASGCRRCQRRAATGTTTKSSAPKNATTRNSAHAVYSSDKHTILDPLFQTQYQTTQSLVHAKTPVNLRVLYDILKNSRISSQTDKCSDVSLR